MPASMKTICTLIMHCRTSKVSSAARRRYLMTAAMSRHAVYGAHSVRIAPVRRLADHPYKHSSGAPVPALRAEVGFLKRRFQDSE